MNRAVQATLLVFVGTSVLQISLSDTFLRYVKEGFRPFLVVSGICLLVLSVATALLDDAAREDAATEDEARDDEARDEAAPLQHDHGHDHENGPRVAWLLVLPVLAILLVAPPALGSFSAARASGAVPEPVSSDFESLPPGDPVDVPLYDYAGRAVWGAGRTLEGRQVALTGFVTPGRGGGWFVTRMSLSCCAADANATKVEVRGAAAPPTDAWVRVTGTWSPSEPSPGGLEVPALRAQDVSPVPQPRNSYE